MKHRTSPSTAKATSSTQRPQTCTEAAAKYYNYIVNEANDLQKRRDWIRQRVKFTVEIIFFDAAIGNKNFARQEYLSNGLRTADQPLHHEQQY